MARFNTHFLFKETGVLIAVFLLIMLPSNDSLAGEVRIASAANFTAAMKEIAQRFEEKTSHNTIISYGSTGKLYAQILHNAPFDVFLAADQQRPEQLVSENIASKRFTYAVGQLALWSSNTDKTVDIKRLQSADFNRLALANPKTAPYGAAALEVLEKLGLSGKLHTKLVKGENISQTHQFVATGNVELGFVAVSQVSLSNDGNTWLVPRDYYQPLRQDAVLLNRGSDNPATHEFLAYLNSDDARNIIEKYGYVTE